MAHAGPRGRVIGVMQRGQTLHPPLLSLPSRSEYFVLLSAAPLPALPSMLGTPVRSNTTLPPHRFLRRVSASVSCCSSSWSLRALRRSLAGAATCARARLTLRSHTRWVYLPSSATSSEFRAPSTFHSASCRPAVFHAGTVLGLPHLQRFLPDRSPVNLSVPGVLLAVSPLARSRLRGCQHRPDALRSST